MSKDFSSLFEPPKRLVLLKSCESSGWGDSKFHRRGWSVFCDPSKDDWRSYPGRWTGEISPLSFLEGECRVNDLQNGRLNPQTNQCEKISCRDLLVNNCCEFYFMWIIVEVVGQYFLHSLPAETIQFDKHIFQLGGSTTNYNDTMFFLQIRPW